jgi:DNA-binding GntR family transcriptional regulator
VCNIPRRGAFVTKLDRKMVQDLYGLRGALEAYGVQLAVANCTQDNVTHLETLVKDMQQAAREGNGTQVIELHMAVHQYLIELSGNTLLQQAWSNIQVQVRRCLTVRHHGYRNWEEIANSHLPLLEMLRQRNAEGAAQAMVEHTMAACNNLMRSWHSNQE